MLKIEKPSIHNQLIMTQKQTRREVHMLLIKQYGEKCHSSYQKIKIG
jgi:hypothetical protein